jgi:hypothetical protein
MSCLFNSLSKFVNVCPQNLRKQICNFLRSNPSILDDISVSDVIKWENGMDIQMYINNMEQSSTWGGCLEIKCFCEIYGVTVKVYYDNRHIDILPESTKSNYTISLLYTGNHYEPLPNKSITFCDIIPRP